MSTFFDYLFMFMYISFMFYLVLPTFLHFNYMFYGFNYVCMSQKNVYHIYVECDMVAVSYPMSCVTFCSGQRNDTDVYTKRAMVYQLS